MASCRLRQRLPLPPQTPHGIQRCPIMPFPLLYGAHLPPLPPHALHVVFVMPAGYHRRLCLAAPSGSHHDLKPAGVDVVDQGLGAWRVGEPFEVAYPVVIAVHYVRHISA